MTINVIFNKRIGAKGMRRGCGGSEGKGQQDEAVDYEREREKQRLTSITSP